MGFSPYPRNYSLLFFIHSSSFSIAELENKTSRFNVSSADIGFTHKFSMIFFTWFLALKKEAFIWIKMESHIHNPNYILSNKHPIY